MDAFVYDYFYDFIWNASIYVTKLTLLEQENSNMDLIKKMLDKFEKEKYEQGFEEGLSVGYKKGLSDVVRSINFLKN